MTASPQLEDGHTRIANELLEAMLLARLTSRQWAVAIALIRKTYGYNKKTDDIGLSQLADMTGLAKSHVSVTVRELEERRIISRKQGKFGHIMGINKNHLIWKGIEKKIAKEVTEEVTVTETVTVTELVPEGYQTSKAGDTETVTTKDKPTKDNKQKKAPRPEVNFKKWIENCKSEGVSPIPRSNSVFEYAKKAKIPDEFLRLHWLEFKDRYFDDDDTKYKAWTTVFKKSVRGNWYRLWYFGNDGSCILSTTGFQAKNVHEETE